jgi:hypothetical protein
MRLPAGAPTRSRQRPAPTSAELKRDANDLESYCLSLIVRQPHLVAMIDEALDRAEQPPLSADDFEQLPNREIFRALRANSIEHTPIIEQVRAGLESVLHGQLDQLLNEPDTRPALSRGESIEQDAQQTGLRLRERRLRREGRELLMVLQDAPTATDDSDIDALQQSSQANAVALLRLQQILSPRTITRQSTTEPWNRS